MLGSEDVCVYIGAELASYGFGAEHPFGPDRMQAFWDRMVERGLDSQVCVRSPASADISTLVQFHTQKYVHRVKHQSETGFGFLDAGDTPAFKGIFEAGSFVVGTVLQGVDSIMSGQCKHVFIPIAGLHHARRDRAAGFCVFNDCGVAIEHLRSRHGVKRIAYVDIDAHHGDGVFYSFNEDPDLIFVDIHEDGRYLYPGTGNVTETGDGKAKNTKLNIPMPPQAGDEQFFRVWEQVEKFLSRSPPEFILFQCGADSLAGDPITHLQYSANAHGFAAKRLRQFANEHCSGRLLVMGGGGYNRENIAAAWTEVVKSLLGTSDQISGTIA